LRNHEPPYIALDDVTDLVGVRIITYFLDDVDRVADLIEAEFSIDEVNSVDRRATIEPDRFGYVSLHYVASLSQPRASLAEWKRFASLRFEVQVRSIVQHAWAEIEHDLGYHGKAAVPAPVRRRFSRLAGLLEVADSEFMGLRDDVARYVKSLPASVEKTPGATSIDQESMLAFIVRNRDVRFLDLNASRYMHSNLDGPEASYAAMLAALFTSLGFKTIGELRTELAKRRSQVIRFVRVWLEPSDEEMPRGASLYFLALIIVAERSDTSDTIELPESLLLDSRSRGLLREAYGASKSTK
jgi:putative GTP pyrophosphokinase